MQHPSEPLKTEYAALLASMTIVRKDEVDRVARRLIASKATYAAVTAKNAVPVLFIAASFEREASSDFRRSPAQGDFWNRVSVHVPKGRGPFGSWLEAAIDAYHLNGLDKVGAGNWTWELMCFYGELFNGFGYRDWHHMRSPYLWGGTNHQDRGKYTSDGQFDPRHFDEQLGIVPVMKRLAELDPALDVGRAVVPYPSTAGLVMQPSPVGLGSGAAGGTKWIQETLNAAAFGPHLDVDGSYGRLTWLAVRNYQMARHLTPDGFAGPETIADLETFSASREVAPEGAA